MNKNIYIILSLLLGFSFSGCASRSMIDNDNPIKPINNLYNRNFIVAQPTYIGNLICGTPFLLLSTAVSSGTNFINDTIYPEEKYRHKHSESYFKFINNIYFVPASICGAIVGAPFIPLSYICDESPWDFNFKFSKNMSYDCRSKPIKINTQVDTNISIDRN